MNTATKTLAGFDPLMKQSSVFIGQLRDHTAVNAAILKKYHELADSRDIERTHHFFGRFENTYVPRQLISEIEPVLELGLEYARLILDNNEPLRVGYWFNEMHSGHQTSLHTHEEDRELLSAVYYITAPENSGDLILHEDDGTSSITPISGRMLLFSPALPHEVSINQSNEMRLSLAMNFGPDTSNHT